MLGFKGSSNDSKDCINGGGKKEEYKTLKSVGINTSIARIIQKELDEALNSFNKNYREDVKNGIAKRLVMLLQNSGYIFDYKKYENYLLGDLTDEDICTLEIYNYNSNFWNTHLKDGNKIRDLTLFEPKDRIEWMNVLKSKTAKRLNDALERGFGVGLQHLIEVGLRPNILEMSQEEENLLVDILDDVKAGKKIFIMLNHETFANIPMAIVKFMQVAKKLGIKDVNKYFTTVIGPLLAVHKWQKCCINLLSNVVITHPADNKISGSKKISANQQKTAGKQMDKDFQDDRQGQIYFCAPSGTRDIVHYGSDGPQIFIPNAEWKSNGLTVRKLKKLYKGNPNMQIYVMATNTTDLKKPNSAVSPNNNKWNRNATVSMHLQKVDMENFDVSKLIFILETNITYLTTKGDKLEEKSCATAISPELFKFLKAFTKTKEYGENGKFSERFLDGNGYVDLNKIE